MKYFRYLVAAAGAVGLLLGLGGSALAYANTPPIDPSYNSRIIDDAIFLNSNSMSVTDIQNFLNSKVPTCDTNHQGGLAQYPPPYTCLKDYIDPTTNKSAAQLIHDEAQSAGINPEVILATLEKEQGLVSDTWPYPSQYKSAMGYGCPESESVCDSAYYGFYNQVHLGAELLRAGEARDCGDTTTLPNWYVSSQWVLGNTVTIDGRSTYLGTCATGSLYNYTPHRPDSAYTLAADGNYYYGNYNFINFFTSWFGQTTNAYLAKGSSSAVYLVNQSVRYTIANPALLSMYSAVFGSVKTFSDSFVSSLGTDPNAPAAGRIARDPTGAIYVLDNGNKYHLDSCTLVADWGGNCNLSTSYNLPQVVVNGFPTGPDVGTLMQDGATSEVDLLTGTQRSPIADMQTLSQNGLSSQPIIQVTDAFFNSIPIGPPLVRDGMVALDAQTGAAVLYQGGAHAVASVTDYINWGFASLPTVSFSDASMSQVTLGSPVTAYAQDGSGNQYLLDHGSKHLLVSAADWPVTNTSLPASYLTAVASGTSIGDLVKTANSANLYVINGGKKRLVPTPTDLVRLGFGSTTPAVLDNDNLGSITSGVADLGTWRTFKTSASAQVDITDGTSAWRLPNAQVASACGIDLSQVLTVDAATFASYDANRNLPLTLSDGTNDYVCDSGYRHFVDPTLLSDYGYTTSSFSTLSASSINYLPAGSNFTHFIKGSGPTIYYIQSGTKRPFSSYTSFTNAGGTTGTTIIVNDQYLTTLPLGTPMP